MISGRKLIKIGRWMLFGPFILILVLILISAIVWGTKNLPNVPLNIAVGFLVFVMVLSIIPLTIGLVKIIVEKIAHKREDASAKGK